MTSSSNHQHPVCSCECAETIVGLQKAIAALQKTVNNLERNELGNLHTQLIIPLFSLYNLYMTCYSTINSARDEAGGKLLSCPAGFVEPSKASWEALERYVLKSVSQ